MEITLAITPNDNLRAEELTAVIEAADAENITPDDWVAQAIRAKLASSESQAA